MGLFIKTVAPDSFWAAIQKTAGDYADLTWSNLFVNNLIPVTIGNIIGGALLVGAMYWFIYLRGKADLAGVPQAGSSDSDADK